MEQWVEFSFVLSEVNFYLIISVQLGKGFDLRVVMTFYIYKGKGIDVINFSYIYSEVMKKVNNFQGMWAKLEEQKYGGEERGQEFFQEGDLGKSGQGGKGIVEGVICDRIKRVLGMFVREGNFQFSYFLVYGIVRFELVCVMFFFRVVFVVFFGFLLFGIVIVVLFVGKC